MTTQTCLVCLMPLIFCEPCGVSHCGCNYQHCPRIVAGGDPWPFEGYALGEIVYDEMPDLEMAYAN